MHLTQGTSRRSSLRHIRKFESFPPYPLRPDTDSVKHHRGGELSTVFVRNPVDRDATQNAKLLNRQRYDTDWSHSRQAEKKRVLVEVAGYYVRRAESATSGKRDN